MRASSYFRTFLLLTDCRLAPGTPRLERRYVGVRAVRCPHPSQRWCDAV
jgi:hypothetical protein